MRSRQLRRRTALLLAAVVAGIVTVGVLVSRDDDRNGHPDPTAPTATRAADPSTIEELPVGARPKIAYVEGQTLYFGDQITDLETDVTSLVEGPRSVLVWSDGNVVEYRRDSTSTVLTRDASDLPVIDLAGKYVAWQESGPGDAVVVVRRLDGSEVDRVLTFPAVASCCDNPFLLHGITTDGRLIASLPSTGRTWSWKFSDPEALAVEIAGLGQASVRAVAGADVVVETSSVIRVGRMAGAAFEVEETYPADWSDFSDPEGRRIVTRTLDGSAVMIRARAGDGATAVKLRFPTEASAVDLRWEDDGHLLIQASDPRTGMFTLLRCDTTTGACERSTDPTGSVLALG